jgi:hypothetical protein
VIFSSQWFPNIFFFFGFSHSEFLDHYHPSKRPSLSPFLSRAKFEFLTRRIINLYFLLSVKSTLFSRKQLTNNFANLNSIPDGGSLNQRPDGLRSILETHFIKQSKEVDEERTLNLIDSNFSLALKIMSQH